MSTVTVHPRTEIHSAPQAAAAIGSDLFVFKVLWAVELVSVCECVYMSMDKIEK